MSMFSQLLGFVAIFVFFACILYVLFGQLTVRKLRKNPNTKDLLGVEYVSGWDIINVAQAFAFPRSWTKKWKIVSFHLSMLMQLCYMRTRLNLIVFLAVYFTGY